MIGRRACGLLRWYLDHEHENMPIDVYATFAEEFQKEVLENEEGCTLPLNLGWVKVIGHKDHAKHRSWDVPKEKRVENYEKGITTFFPSHHTSGWVFKFYWYSTPIGSVEDITLLKFFNSDIYTFLPSTAFRRKLYTKIHAGEWDHYHQKSFFKAPRVQAQRGRPKRDKNKELDEHDETADHIEA